MIIESIVNIIYPVLNYIVGLLPDADTNILSFIGSGVSYFRTVVNFGEAYFDMYSLLLALGFVLAIELILLIFKVARWVITIISVGFIKAN